jgi:hypothetical protein
LSRPAAVTAPRTAENVWRGTPIQSAHAPNSRLSSSRVSPTSNTTERITLPAYGQRSPYGDRVINKIKLPYLLGFVRGIATGRLVRLRRARTITSKFTGDSHFADYNDSDDYPSLPASEIDTSEAEEALPDGTYLVTVEGDGAWTLRRSGRM